MYLIGEASVVESRIVSFLGLTYLSSKRRSSLELCSAK